MSSEPPTHHVRAAVEVARIIDAAGNSGDDVRGSYLHVPTGGEHDTSSLVAGERLLVELGLLIERDGRLYPAGALHVLAKVQRPEAESLIRSAHRSHVDQELLDRIGAAGEVAVVDVCQDNLAALGHPQLADQVQQVSSFDDSLGYDVLAPVIAGAVRMLEVKTSARSTPGIFQFYLSRNEYDVGRRHPDSWALVACTWNGTGATVLGWCRASVLTTYLPTDGLGRWTEAHAKFPTHLLTPGVPPPV